MKGCLSIVLVVLVGLPLLFVPPHPPAGGWWVDCEPAPMTVFGAQVETDSSGFAGTTRPPFQVGSSAMDVDVPAGVANSACMRASIIRLAWAVPACVGLALLPSMLVRVTQRKGDAAGKARPNDSQADGT